MAIPRRRFLGFLVVPAAVGAAPAVARTHEAGSAASQSAAAGARSQVDPQIQRLRAMTIDEHVEPALICVPDLGA